MHQLASVSGGDCERETRGRGWRFYRTGANGTRLCEDAVQVDGENSNSEDKAGDRGVLTRAVR